MLRIEELFDGTLGDPKAVPVLGLSFEDGAALYAAVEAGPVSVRAFASVEVNWNAKTTNVIADSVVLVGAHLDSVAAGPGINDNGSGTATTLYDV